MAPCNFPPRNEVLAFYNKLDLFYARDLNRDTQPIHVDAEGIAVWLGEYLRLRTNGYPDADASLSVFDQIHGKAPPPVPLPVPPTPVPTLQRLRTSGRHIVRDDGSLYIPVIVSAFSTLKQWIQGGQAAIDPVVNEIIATFGYETELRVFRYAADWNPFSLEAKWDAERLGQMVGLSRYLLSRGLRIYWTTGDAQMRLPDQHRQQDEVNATYGAIEGEVNCRYQTCNEAFKNGIDTKVVRPPSGRVLRSSGNYGEKWGDATEAGTLLDVLAYHSVRDGLDGDYPKAIWDPPEEMFSFIQTPIDDEEPFGFDEVLTGSRSNNPHHGLLLAIERTIWGLGVGFHCNDYISGRTMRPNTARCAQEFVRGLRATGVR